MANKLVNIQYQAQTMLDLNDENKLAEIIQASEEGQVSINGILIRPDLRFEISDAAGRQGGLTLDDAMTKLKNLLSK